MCVCIKVFYQVNASHTAHELLLANGEHVPALQHLRVGAAGVDAGHEGLFCHPDGKPLELAVAQQAGGVQMPARGEDRNISFAKAVTLFRLFAFLWLRFCIVCKVNI